MDEKQQKQEKCHILNSQGLEAWCTREKCIYWRLLEPQDLDVSNEHGCGLKHFDIVTSIDSETASWLIEMKERLEDTTPEVGKARITFRHRE